MDGCKKGLVRNGGVAEDLVIFDATPLCSQALPLNKFAGNLLCTHSVSFYVFVSKAGLRHNWFSSAQILDNLRYIICIFFQLDFGVGYLFIYLDFTL